MSSTDETIVPAPNTAAEAGYRSVLVPLDGSPLAERALAPGVALAAGFGAELHVVADAIHRDERWWYQDYLDRVSADYPGLITHVATRPHAGPGIVATAHELDPCLVCMGTHGRARSAALVGSTFVEVAAGLEAPMVAVGPHAATAPPTGAADRIAVCLDGLPPAEQALPVAAAWARRLGARLTLLTAADPLLVRSWLGEARSAATGHYPPRGDPEHYLAMLAARPMFAGLVVDREVLWGVSGACGVVGERLERRPASIVVAAMHTRTGLSRLALGSTVARMVHESRVPVLAVPVRPDGPGGSPS